MVAKETTPGIERCQVLGVGISTLDLRSAVREIFHWVEAGQQKYVCVTGMHGVIECQRDAELKRIHNHAGMVTPDGMPMVWLSRLHGFRGVSRVYGPDLMLAVCDASGHQGTRHFFFGGADGVPELLATRLGNRFPGLHVAGTFSPPFRPMTPAEDRELVTRINASGADIVWVGLSTPKQERWMAAHRTHLAAPVLIGVGAAFDFHAGLKRQAPRWMQRGGLEWAFRLGCEPRRLWRRYLVGIPQFLGYLAMEQMRLRDFAPADDLPQEAKHA